jgi:hypothetical protein
MMTSEFINEHFEINKITGTRWRFETIQWKSPTPEHRYFLTFLVHERRFILSRQKVVQPVSVDDTEQMDEFRQMLTNEEIADCTRLAMTSPPPEETEVPF